MAHEHDGHRDSRPAVGSEDVEYQLDAGSNRVEVRPGLAQGLEAWARGQEHPIVGLVEHQHQQPDTAEGEHLAEQEDVAGWACHRFDYRYGADRAVS